MEHRKINLRFWFIYHIGILLWALVTTGVIKYFQEGNSFSSTFVATAFTIFFISIFIGYLAIFMTKKAKNLNQKELRKRIVPALLIFYAGAFLIANVIVSIGVFGWFIYTGRDLSGYFPHLFRYELSFANSSFAMWLMFFTIAFFYVLWQKTSKREQELTKENLMYRYNTLKSQVNPHFLFNSLNTLSELVYENAEKADNYIQKLSGIYRYVLENEEKDLIPLQKEINFVQSYVELQKERDTEKLNFEIDVSRSEDFEIIPVSLQLLVENALKHNSVSKKSPLKIKIYRKGDYIEVSNNKQKKNILSGSTQKGLSNLSQRARLITGKELIVRENIISFVVLLPIIHKNL